VVCPPRENMRWEAAREEEEEEEEERPPSEQESESITRAIAMNHQAVVK
jgi:hypothetical protein